MASAVRIRPAPHHLRDWWWPPRLKADGCYADSGHPSTPGLGAQPEASE